MNPITPKTERPASTQLRRVVFGGSLKYPLAVALLFAALSATAASADDIVPAKFPLKLSENRRHLVDQRGAQFPCHADTAWMLFMRLTEAEGTAVDRFVSH